MDSDIVRVPVINRTFCGIDASLTSTGFCLKTGNEIKTDTIKTKPDKFKNDLDRLKYIAAEIMKRIPRDTAMVCLEDVFVAFSAAQVNSSISLSRLATTVRLSLYDSGLPFLVVAPTSLKKFVLGKGTGEKDLILMEVYKKYGISAENNDVADAIVLCHIAEYFHQALSGTLGDVPKYQKEVIKSLMDARTERGYNLESQ